MENPIKMDDLGVPLFSETSISDCSHGFIHLYGMYNQKQIDVFLCYVFIHPATMTSSIQSLPVQHFVKRAFVLNFKTRQQ